MRRQTERTMYEALSKHDLSQKQYVSLKQYVYLWADEIHVNVRLEDDAERKQRILVLMRATPDGRK